MVCPQSMRAMSRGLSQFQRWVMDTIERRGNITLKDVHEIALEKCLEENGSAEAQNLRGMFSWLWECCRDAIPIKKYYHTMDSLQRRGLVASLLHVRPMVWYHVTWAEGKPLIKLDDHTTVPLAHNGSGKIEYRTKNRIWTAR